ncbi:hypothetical protein BWQ96_09753 [Gracilariopsis chorda]|uniref:VOC domain-containing protein n=1 Tax=Gracilariopsis chorda TaxID=448386 RepID=A0A2V3IEU3_9FLOR|nr:hypothetical protein BWQ96_09753 [Gracilariopsis chorda]|eukprot:PXF40538.1 hypothetical protein BWQ96_09753 [Gracilariopsis chorda]
MTKIGTHGLTPYITVKNAASTIDFYKDCFGGEEKFKRWLSPDGMVAHAELEFGATKVFVADPCEKWGTAAPGPNEGKSLFLYLHVEDLKATLEKAKANGAEELEGISDVRPYGCREARVKCPGGYIWTLSQKVTDPSEEDMEAARLKFEQNGDM